MAVAIFPQAMIATVAIKNASIIVPESHIITFLEISNRVRKKVIGITIARIDRIKRLFSWLAILVSVI